MALFSIECPTCRTRLSVRHASAIGQLLTCPKCNSFVQVVAPPGWTPPPEVAASLADTVVDSLDSPSAHSTETILAEATPAPVARATSDRTPAATANLQTLPQARETSPPPVESPSSRHPWTTRDKALAASLSLAILLFLAVFFMRGPGRSVIGQAERSAAPPAKNPSLAPAPKNAERAGPEEVEAGPPADRTALEDEPKSGAPIGSPTAADSPVNASQEPGVPVAPEVPLESPVEAASPTDAPDSPGVDVPVNANEGDAPAESAFPDSADSPPPDEIADPVRASSETTDAVDAANPPGDVPLPPGLPAQVVVDVNARLAGPVSSIELAEMELLNFVRLISAMTTVPISLDLDALADAGISPRTRLSCRARDTSYGALLTDSFATLKLHAVELEHQLWVTATEATSPESAVGLHRLEAGDLVSLAPQARDAFLAGAWNALADETDQPRAIAFEAGNLQFESSPRTAARIARWLRRWRQAHEPSSDATDAWRVAQAALRRPVSLNFFRPTPVVAVLEALAERGGVLLPVNELALARAGVSRSAEVRLRLTAVSLEQALGELLSPLGLTFRPVEADVLEITTVAELPVETAIYSFPTEVDLRTMVAEAEAALAGTRAAPPPGWAGLDPRGGIMVLAPADVQRVLAEKWQPAGP